MARIPETVLNEIRSRLPVSVVVGKSVQLKKKGAEWEGLSPFNAEKTPSFTVNDQKQFYHCFSSGKHGDIFTFLQETLGCSFHEAVTMLASEAGVSIEGTGAGQPVKAPPRQQRSERTSEAGSTDRPKNGSGKPKREIRSTYDYTDPNGNLVYQVVRYEPKGFAQRRPSPDGDGAWIWGLDAGEFMRKGPGSDWIKFDKDRFQQWGYTERKTFFDEVEHGLYRVPELREAIAGGDLVFLPEGEKDADRLWSIGFPATTNSGGAKHWSPLHAELFRGADVVIPVDNDNPGRERGDIIARSLKGIAKRVRVLDLAAHWPGMPEKADITDWLDNGGTDEALLAIVDKTPEWKPAARPSKLGLVLWSDVESNIEPHEFLVEDLITAGEVALIGGDSGAGKTFLTLDLAMSVALGTPFLDRFKVKQGGVLYQPGEGSRGLRTLRIPAYKKAHELCDDDRIPFGVLNSSVNLYKDDADTDALIEDIQLASELMDCPIRLLVIDTVSKATPGADENSGKDVGPVLQRCQRIRDKTGVTVLLVAHTNASGAKIRGHTSWRADVDSVLICSRRTDGKNVGMDKDANGREIRDLQVVKLKDGEDGKKFSFVLRGHTLGERTDGKPLTSCTVEPPDMGMLKDTREDISQPAKRLSDRPYNYLKAIESALADHGQVPPPEVKLPSGVFVVNRRHVRDAYSLLYQGQEEDPVKRDQNMRKARERLGEVLLARGYMGQHKDWIWLTGKHKRRQNVTKREESVTPPNRSVTSDGWSVTENGTPVTNDDPGW